MIEEQLSDAERMVIKAALIAAVPRDAPHPLVISALRKIEGTDTVLVARRAYASSWPYDQMVKSDTDCRVPSRQHRYDADGRCQWCDAEKGLFDGQ